MGKRLLSLFHSSTFHGPGRRLRHKRPGVTQTGNSADETTLRILSGSENQELENIIQDSARNAGIRVERIIKDPWILCGTGNRRRRIRRCMACQQHMDFPRR